MCTYISDRIEKCMTYISCSWIPQSPTTLAFATFAAFYGRRLGETYAPGYIAEFLIKKTVVFMGSETIGKVTGAAIVAPMFTPELTPLAVMAAGFAMFYIAVLIGNLIHKIFTHLTKPKPTPQVQTPSLPAITPISQPSGKVNGAMRRAAMAIQDGMLSI